MALRFGLRGKSVIALLLICAVAVLLATAFSWQAIDAIRTHFGQAYARNFTLYSKQKIVAPVQRELALSQRLANSSLTRQWLLAENDATRRAQFFREVEGYRAEFADHSYFVVSALSNHYYLNDAVKPNSEAPRYKLSPSKPTDAWFYDTLRTTERFNLNVDLDVELGLTKVWFNVIIYDGSRKLGLAGTGLDLSAFLRDFVGHAEPGVTPMILDRFGSIQAHPDRAKIAFNSASKQAVSDKSLYRLLSPVDEVAAKAALSTAKMVPESVQVFHAQLDGAPRLLAASYIPELQWYVLTAIDLDDAKVVDTRLWLHLVVGGILLLLALAGGFAYAVNQLVLAPLFRLTQSAQAMAAGDYAIDLPRGRQDEIGSLTAAFMAMADKVRRHTTELEQRVAERTQELSEANRHLATTNKKLADSIDYASLIQRAILPEHQMMQDLGQDHFVLWRPRDVVGGDFYIYRQAERGCLIGVVDCAGHGVPGAFMTMLAHAALDLAIDEVGPTDPAGILSRTDTAVRTMLHLEGADHRLATTMDVGLAFVDSSVRQVIFAGAKISLYWCEGDEVGQVEGDRRAIGDRRPGRFNNHRLELRPDRTFYLTTDGFLDQAGGDKGFGFGSGRFVDMLRQHAGQVLSEQCQNFETTLAKYQGEHPQRDDITLVSFRFK
ncbi:biofilm regulation protein phosphatase SiaA [Parachitinimonas caeni]|uniref:Biofilm regulation protein phosphatase SiaA n=1 Tax=Parachitinimonas caeni TaxID=3031301 RepID=A0ABT7E3T6_9NEIS|nr:biofilm regulation protein phosphatase SiaA [Parachitinimonas caeni]MDK2126070.1 biofilm regulation protein phosphatase SiaA [Parachitinimonas caeni]